MARKLSHGQAMVMDGRIRISFRTKILVTMLSLCWIVASAFIMYRFHREKEFKIEMLDVRLQTYNKGVLEDLSQGSDINDIVKFIPPPFKNLRLTLVDPNGKVVFDNNDRTPFPTANHNDRPEIVRARRKGSAYVVARRSENDNKDYFYSARLANDGYVVRSAVPYSHSLQEFLMADTSFLWVMLAIPVVVSIVGYFITHKISMSISRLNTFAEKARKGEPIFGDEPFPDDELGNIAVNIVRLYIQREDQYKKVIEEERDKIRLKKRLTNDINHELKTPVSSILVCTDLLRDHPELPEEKRVEMLQRIHDNTVRLKSLLEDVSKITRMDDGMSAIAKAPADISALVRNVVAEESLKTDMRISVDIPDMTLTVNKNLIESVFRNLISNAIAYSGGSEIFVTGDRNGNFTVRDNGRGIQEEHLPHIFERFYRIEKGRSRETGGTGLGLAIVKNAVMIHGGNIRVSNDSGLRYDFNLSTDP